MLTGTIRATSRTVLVAFLCLPVAVMAQSHGLFLEVKKSLHAYNIILTDTGGTIFTMGKVWDKAGHCHTIRDKQTLIKSGIDTFTGRSVSVIKTDDKYVLRIPKGKRYKTFGTDTIRDVTKMNEELNNGYFHTEYFAMCREMNMRYPLNHTSFREAFEIWKKISFKDTPHAAFSPLADLIVKQKKDSTILVQDHYVSTTNRLLANIATMNYNTFLDSLRQLPAVYRSESEYFSEVVNITGNVRPDFFLRLIEDMPEKKTLIIYAVDIKDKHLLRKIRNVAGHDSAKKEFFKELKEDRRLTYTGVASAIVAVSLLAYILVSIL